MVDYVISNGPFGTGDKKTLEIIKKDDKLQVAAK